MRTLGAALLVAVVLGSAAAGAGAAADEREGVRRAEAAYVAAWLKNDPEAIMRTLADDAVMMPPGMPPLETREAIRNFWFPADGSRTTILTMNNTLDEVEISGDLAYVRGRTHLRFRYEKDGTAQEIENQTKFMSVLRQSHGEWRIARRIWNPLPAAK